MARYVKHEIPPASPPAPPRVDLARFETVGAGVVTGIWAYMAPGIHGPDDIKRADYFGPAVERGLRRGDRIECTALSADGGMWCASLVVAVVVPKPTFQRLPQLLTVALSEVFIGPPDEAPASLKAVA